MTTSVTANEMRLFDEWATNSIGIPSMLLMENAGKNVADEIYNIFFAKKKTYTQVDIFCGTGDNGGDGLVIARHLFIKGVKVKVFIIGGISALSPDAELNFRILRKIGVMVSPILSEKDIMKIRLGKKDVIIDAVLGIGLNREVSDVQKDIIDFINKTKMPVISVDIPSGLNATTGEEWGACVKATRTITFVFPKKGFFLRKGKEVTGKLSVVDIGIPQNVKVEKI
jgi:ADP-dependent NAD(P)H-hydrate dehydratase / NAD(P)H-hydrate epimerase